LAGRCKVAASAAADIVSILRTSRKRHGDRSRIRCRALIRAAMRAAANDPNGAATADRGKFENGLRSLHLRHCRNESLGERVGNPVHLIFCRAIGSGYIEIARVLNERRHLVPHMFLDPDRKSPDIP